MIVLKTISDAKAYIWEKKKNGQSIGFVPTMGALHQGHISLVERATRENDLVVCSIFVNPTQFDNPEDLKKYPRTLEADTSLLEAAGCHMIFAPFTDEMYSSLPEIKMDFGNLEHVMEGKYRAGHFNGVGIVVSKLFHIINPDKAYFGLKDLQQVSVINRLVKDLSFDLELIPCPTIREKDGLAMSSRNTRLSDSARKLAPEINNSLEIAKSLIINGMKSITVKKEIDKHFKKYPEFTLEYFEISDFESLEPIKEKNPAGQTAVCIAAYLDNVRLIDNVVF